MEEKDSAWRWFNRHILREDPTVEGGEWSSPGGVLVTLYLGGLGFCLLSYLLS